MNQPYNSHAPKKPTNVSINSDLLEKARSLKINLSATLEQALVLQVKANLQAEWKSDNKVAIEEYNRLVGEHGVFSDDLRQF